MNISLVYGLYSGIVIQSLRKGLSLLKKGVNQHSLNELFEFLFVKYENPHFLTHNLNSINTKELEALIHVLQGNSIRRFNDLPFPISKKESYYFALNIYRPVFMEDKILEKSIIICKLLSTHDDAKLLESFLSSIRYFRNKPYEFYEQLDFWKSTFKFLGRFNWDDTLEEVSSYVDFIIYKRFVDDPNYSLKGRTPNSLTRAMLMWHEMGAFTNQKELEEKTWGKSKPLKFELDNEQYLFEEITNGKDLLKESAEMKNCVFSYIKDCCAGYTRIWSAKIKSGSQYIHHLTIEVDRKRVTQALRMRNKNASKQDKAAIDYWAEEMEFIVGKYFY